MTKADVLDAFKDLEVCTSYKINGKESREIPFRLDRMTGRSLCIKHFRGGIYRASAAKIV